MLVLECRSLSGSLKKCWFSSSPKKCKSLCGSVKKCRSLSSSVKKCKSLSDRVKNFRSTGPRSAVVSASDCGSEGLGFESHQSHVGFFGPGRLLPRAGSAMGPVGRLEPHSRASST